MSIHQQRLYNALEQLLQHIAPPAPSAILTQEQTPAQVDTGATITPIQIRWPKTTTTVNAVIDALTAHDLLCIAVHAMIMQHGGKLISQQHNTQSSSSNTNTTPFTLMPPQWNSSDLLYTFKYVLSTPSEHTVESQQQDVPANAEALTAAAAICYLLVVKCLPLRQYLILNAQLFHVSPVPGVKNTVPVSAAFKLTLRCDEYVSCETVQRYVAHMREQQTATAPVAVLPVFVYHHLDRLITAVHNAILKRCLGPLWFTFFSPSSSANTFQSPYFPDLPVDLLISILSFLNSRELARLSVVSSAMAEAAGHPLLWQMLCERELSIKERLNVHKTDWKNEFIIRKRIKHEENERNKFALVPVGEPIGFTPTVNGHRGGDRDTRDPDAPLFTLPALNGREVNDPLGLRDWRVGGGGRRGMGGFRV